MTSLATLRTLIRGFIIGSAAALLVALPAAAGGFLDNSKPKASPAPEYAAPAARRPVEGDENAAWEAKLYNAKLRVVESYQNYDTARYNLTRARTRRYPRGDALEEMRGQVQELSHERAASEADFSTTLQDARRAGVPAGVLAAYMDLEDQIRRLQTDRKAEDR